MKNTHISKNLYYQIKRFAEEIIEQKANYSANHSRPVPKNAGKSQYSLKKIGLVSCLVLFVISVLCSCGFFFALVLLPKYLLPVPIALESQNNSDKEKLNLGLLDKRIQDLFGPDSLIKEDDTFLVSINEEKVKELIVDSYGKNYPKEYLEKGLSVDFEPDLIILQSDTKLILKSNTDTFPQNDKLGFDVPAFNQVLLQNLSPNFINLEITTSDDGKKFIVDKFSTENLDSESFLSKQIARVLEIEIDKFITQNLSQNHYSLEKVEIEKDILYLKIRDKNLTKDNTL